MPIEGRSANYIATAGALEDRQFELIEYVPGYRSSAGTGGGWTWGVWKKVKN